MEYMKCCNCHQIEHLAPCGLCIFCVPSEFEGEEDECSRCHDISILSSKGLCVCCEVITAEYVQNPKA